MPPRRRFRPGEDPAPYGRRPSQEDEPYDEDETYDEREDEPRRRRTLNAASAGRLGLRYIADLTAKDAEGVTLVEPVEDGWVIGVEVVEDRRIPSSSDMLSIYEVQVDDEGNLLSYRRTRSYRRGTGAFGGAP